MSSMCIFPPLRVLAAAVATGILLCTHTARATDEPVPAESVPEKPVPPPAAVKPKIITGNDVPKEEIVNSRLAARMGMSARQIILEAHLDDNLRNHVGELAGNVGQADGRLCIGGYITVMNGEAMLDFVRVHGYKGFHGPVEIRKWPGGRKEVDVRITAPNGKSMIVTLLADGARQGEG